MYFIVNIKIIIAHRAIKCIKFFKWHDKCQPMGQKARHKPTSAIL